MLQTPISTPSGPKPKPKSEMAPASNLRTRLLKRRREEVEEEELSPRIMKEYTQKDRVADQESAVEDGTTEKSDTPSESKKDDAELHTDVRRENAHPIPYNASLPHFPLNAIPPRQIYDAHLQHAAVQSKDLYDLIAYHHAIHNAAHLHGYHSSTKRGQGYTTTTTHTFVHKGHGRGFR